jgi:hypothetical protein
MAVELTLDAANLTDADLAGAEQLPDARSLWA